MMQRRRLFPNRRRFLTHLSRNAALMVVFVAIALTVGAIGYHRWAGLSWVDAYLNAAMILTGMGPLAPLETTRAKLFGMLYALFSGVAFVTIVAVLLAPGAHRLLTRFHADLEIRSDEDAGKKGSGPAQAA
jgi:hypothetical protein